MEIAYKFKGYRVLLIHGEEPCWDDIHSRIMKTDCDLFAVNSTKDAQRLMQLMEFDIIISAYDRDEATGRECSEMKTVPTAIPLKSCRTNGPATA